MTLLEKQSSAAEDEEPSDADEQQAERQKDLNWGAIEEDTMRDHKRLQTCRRIKGRTGAHSSRCRRTCCRIRSGCSNKPRNIRP